MAKGLSRSGSITISRRSYVHRVQFIESWEEGGKVLLTISEDREQTLEDLSTHLYRLR